MAAIEIDKENNLVENETAPSHFCVLPLVGSEKHIMPIYLNSPDFEPDSERESLILIGEDMLALIFRCNCATCFGDVVPQKKE